MARPPTRRTGNAEAQVRRRVSAAALVGAVWAVLIVVPRAEAVSAIPLGMDHFAAMAVDLAHGHLFFSGGAGSSQVVVPDLAGGARQAVPNLPAATGMALSADGGTLYVAVANDDAVAALNTATLTVTRRYALG